MKDSNSESYVYGPIRVIDSEFEVKEQNKAMVELTGIDGNRQSVECDEQLMIHECERRCPLKRSPDTNHKNQYLNQNEQFINQEVTVELPNGDTRRMSIVVETITDDSGEITGIFESFKDISGLQKARERNLQPAVSEPYNQPSFRAALKQLLHQAASNGVAFADRSWEITSDEESEQWDVEITTVRKF